MIELDARPVANRPTRDLVPADSPLGRSLRLAFEEKIWTPRTELGVTVKRALHFLPHDLALELLDHVRRSVQMESALSLVHMAGDGGVEVLGVVSRKVITDAGVAYIVDAFQNLTEVESLKFHGIGTGGTAEAASQTALVTELTTQYNPDSTRATGSLTENAANIFRTVAINLVDAAVAITEHGIFSQAATGGGTMLDRSLFSVVNLGIGDSLQSTYDLTLTSGG